MLAEGLCLSTNSCKQGKAALEQQAQQIAAALKTACIVTLGGVSEAGKQWGQCLGVRADGSLAQIRSSLGNALAHASASQGLRAIGVIAYVEVLQLLFGCILSKAEVCLTRAETALHHWYISYMSCLVHMLVLMGISVVQLQNSNQTLTTANNHAGFLYKCVLLAVSVWHIVGTVTEQWRRTNEGQAHAGYINPLSSSNLGRLCRKPCKARPR